MIKSKYMFSEAKAKAKDTTSEAKAKAKDLAFKAKDLAPKAKAKAKDMTSCPRGASRPRPWPRGLHLCLFVITSFDKMTNTFSGITMGTNGGTARGATTASKDSDL